MKASTLIRNAFVRIGKTGASQSISGEDTETAISRLNNLMRSVSWIGMGHTEVTSATDDITTPEYSWEWMEMKLAIKLSPEYGQLESYVSLKEDIAEAWSPILASLNTIGPPQMHGNLPRGYGNRRMGDRCGRYYTETDNGVLSETNQAVIVEDDTE